LFIAPSSEISVGFLEAQTLAFYREINATSNVTRAYKATLGAAMDLLHCQGLFLQSILRYVRTYCSGQRRRDRLERMVTAILQRDGIAEPSSTQLREVRRNVRQALEPGQSLIDRFAPLFLIGRSAAFTYADVDRVLKRSRSTARPHRRLPSS